MKGFRQEAPPVHQGGRRENVCTACKDRVRALSSLRARSDHSSSYLDSAETKAALGGRIGTEWTTSAAAAASSSSQLQRMRSCGCSNGRRSAETSRPRRASTPSLSASMPLACSITSLALERRLKLDRPLEQERGGIGRLAVDGRHERQLAVSETGSCRRLRRRRPASPDRAKEVRKSGSVSLRGQTCTSCEAVLGEDRAPEAVEVATRARLREPRCVRRRSSIVPAGRMLPSSAATYW